MNSREYFDESPDEYDYRVIPKRYSYRGSLVIPFRIHLANCIATQIRRQSVKHYLI